MLFLKIASLSTLLIGALAVGNTCTDNCINNLLDNPANVGCPVKKEAGCICVKPGFREGLQQCAVTGCKYTGSLDELVQVQCGANKLAPEPSAAPSSSATSSSTSAPSTSSSAPVATSSTSSTAPTSTSQASTQTPSGTAQQSVASTSSATASATTSSAAQTSSADSVSTGGGGLSHAAGVGIGVGVAAAVVAAAVVGFCVFRNRKKGQQKSHHSMEISKPLPGSGRTYPADERTSLDKYNNDIEMSSNRYEDMAQGQQPRTMV